LELRKEYDSGVSTNSLVAEGEDNEQHAVIEVIPTPSNSNNY
jgi:hypothetical protein